jgi:hypothetical protein
VLVQAQARVDAQDVVDAVDHVRFVHITECI